jgi:hypothetical protein
MTDMICKAIIEQGASKGKRCSRPDSGNGYCGKHFKQAILTTYDKTTHQKCSHTRCNAIIPLTPGRYVYCEPCQKTRDEERAKLKLCKGADGVKCPFEAGESGYCGKHETRGILLEHAAEQGVKICGDGKLPCKNILTNGRSRCEDCLEKERIKDAARYAARVNDEEACLGCGKAIQSYIMGSNGMPVKRCQPCYDKLRLTEETRERVRNLSEEKYANIPRNYDKCKRDAIKRNLQFMLTLEEYTLLIKSACTYCEQYTENEAIGIDRVNSSFGYLPTNVVPCCSICNVMKNNLPLDIFKEHITKIYNTLQKKQITQVHTAIPPQSSFIKPAKIAEFYTSKRMPEFVELCKKDSRHPMFIERMEAASRLTFTHIEFLDYVRTALKTEMNKAKVIPQRMSHTEFYTYFDNGTPRLAIELYETIYGKTEGLEEDLMTLFRDWAIFDKKERLDRCKSLIVKYQNKRYKDSKAAIIESPLHV